jgi:hypothetical protein
VKQIVILFAFALQSCVFGNVIIEAEGFGESPKEAKRSALRELSHSIVSEVNSEVSMKQVAIEGRVSKSIATELTLKSSVILRGVEYDRPQRRDNYFYTKARLTKRALRESIEVLQDRIDVKASTLNRKQIEQKLLELEILSPLALISGDSRVKNFIVEKREEFLLQMNYGEIVFDVEPRDSVVRISNSYYRPFESIYLKEGKYHYSVQSSGYQSQSGKLYLYKGSRDRKSVTLLADIGERSLEVDSDEAHRELIEATLRDHNILPVAKSDRYRVSYRFKKEKTVKVDGYQFYTLVVEAKLYRDGSVFARKKASLKNKTESYLNSREDRVIQLLTKALFSGGKLEKFFK